MHVMANNAINSAGVDRTSLTRGHSCVSLGLEGRNIRMELRQFVKQALCDIAGAVKDARAEADGAEIAPDVGSSYKAIEIGISQVQSVESEVAVNTEKKSGSEAKLNVVAALVGGGVGGNSTDSTAHAATLRSRVPIRFVKNVKD